MGTDKKILVTAVKGLGLVATPLSQKSKHVIEGDVEVSANFVQRAEAFTEACAELSTHVAEFEQLIGRTQL